MCISRIEASGIFNPHHEIQRHQQLPIKTKIAAAAIEC